MLGAISIGSGVRDLVLRNDFAYIAAYTLGYRTVDVSNPAIPEIEAAIDSCYEWWERTGPAHARSASGYGDERDGDATPGPPPQSAPYRRIRGRD